MDWRSEVEAARQMVAIHETLGMPSAAHPHRAVVAMGAALETALRERDEARAEVERLRARLHRCAQCGADDSALAACEGDEYPLCGPCAANEIRRTLPEALRLAAVDEREACAAIADEYAAQEDVAGADACARLADAIRARGTGGVE